LKILTNHLRTYGKYFRRLQQLDASRFVELPRYADMVLYYWQLVVDATGGSTELVAGEAQPSVFSIPTLTGYLIVDNYEAVYPIRLLVQGMVLFKDSLTQWAPKRRDGSDNLSSKLSIQHLLTPILIFTALSRGFVENAVQLLITRFMPLNPTDLQQWLTDPEEWLHVEDKENDQWEFEIRVSAVDRFHVHFC
jgi:hypothetical protein